MGGGNKSMSKVVDSRVVEMSFDNSKFEKGVKQSIATLTNLNAKIKATESTDSFKKLGDSINGINLDGISSSLNTLVGKFSAGGIAAMTVVQDVTRGIMQKAKQAFDFVGDLIVQGGIRRASNIENAKFQLEGLGIKYKDLEGAIDYAVTNTAYGLDQAAIAASQLAASGLDYKEIIGVHKTDGQELTRMSMALRAVSGVAAQTQTDYSMVARYFQDVANAGKVTGSTLTYMTQVLNLPVKQDLAEGLKAIADGSYEATEAVQKNVKKLGNLEKVTAEDVAEFAKDGLIDFETFSTIMFNKYADHAVAANNTLEGVKSNIRAAFAKIGADFIQPIIANGSPLVKFLDEVRAEVNQIRKGIQPFSQYLAQIVNNKFFKLTNVLKELDLGNKLKLGKSLAIDLDRVLIQLGHTIESIVKPIKEAFGDVFNDDIKEANKNAKSLHTRLVELKDIIVKIRLEDGGEKAEKLKSIFKGLFAIFNIGKNVISSFFQILVKVIGHLSGFSGTLIDATASIGDMIYKFNGFLEKSGFFEKFVEKVSGFLIKFIDIVRDVAGFLPIAKKAVADFFSTLIEKIKAVTGLKLDKFTANISKIPGTIAGAFKKSKKELDGFGKENSKILERLSPITDKIKEMFGKKVDIPLFDKIKESLKIGIVGVKVWLKINLPTIKDTALEKLGEFKESLQKFFSPGDFRFIHNTVNTILGAGIFGGLILWVKKFVNAMKSATTISDFTKMFKTETQNILKTLRNIPANLNLTLKNVNNVLGEVKNTLKAYQQQIKAETLKKIAIAVAILAGSVLVLSLINPGRLTAATIAIGALVGVLVNAMDDLYGINGFSGSKSKGSSDPTSTMIKLAAAVYIFAAALKKIGKLDPVQMAASVAAISTIMWELVGVIAKLNKMGLNDFGKDTSKAISSLILLGVALNIIASAVKKLGKLSWEELTKGVGAITAILAVLASFFKVMDMALKYKNSAKDIAKICGALVSLSVSLAIIAGVAKIFATMSWEDLAKAGTAIGALMAAIALFTATMSASMEHRNDAKQIQKIMLSMAASLAIFAGVAKVFAGMSWDELSKAGAAIGVLLLEIAIFVRLITKVGDPKSMAKIAAGLLIVGFALTAMSGAVSKIAKAGDWKQIAAATSSIILLLAAVSAMAKLVDPKKLIKTAVALLMVGPGLKAIAKAISVLAGTSLTDIVGPLAAMAGVMLMLGMLAESIDPARLIAAGLAIAVMSTGIDNIAKAISVLGSMALVDIGKALLAVLGVFLALGVIAVVLAPVAPVILLLSVSLLALGVAVALAGAGVLTLAAGLILLSSAINLVAGISEGALASFFEKLAQFVPFIVKCIGELIVGVIQSIVDAKVQILQLLLNFGEMILTVIERLAPRIISVLMTLIIWLLTALRTIIPDIVTTVMDICLAILQAIAERIPEFAQAATDIITAFLQAISDSSVQIVDAAFQMIITFINGLTETINTRTPELVEAVNGLMHALLNAAIVVLTGGKVDLTTKGGELLAALKQGFEEKVSQILDFFKTLIHDIGERIKGCKDDMKRSGGFIIDGLKEGIDNAKQRVLDTISNLGNAIKEAFNFSVNINSPSKDFAESGMYIVLGLVKGIKDYASKAVNEAGQLGEDVLAETNDVLSGLTDVFTDMDDFNPVITPTLDLSRLNAGASQISSMLGRHNVKVSGDVQNGGTNSGGVSYNFTQNNYSPEALSRYEIYRQTKNQLSMMKGVVKNA